MRSFQSISLAAAAALLAAPAAASAAQTMYGSTPPVTIAACSARAGTPISFGTVGFANFGSYSISFINQSNVAAQHVGLDVKSGGALQRVDANGSFALGTRIDMEGSEPFFANGSAGGAVNCSVAEVDFIDGSSWHAVSKTALSTPAFARTVARR